MKAFAFRLEQALRWRETQLQLQKSRVAAAAARLAEFEAISTALKAELSNAAILIADTSTGGILGSYAGFKEKLRVRIRDSDARIVVARRTVSLEMNRLIEANQKARLLENLKQTDQARWHKEFDRELAAFADEAFLGRIQSEDRRARSSGG